MTLKIATFLCLINLCLSGVIIDLQGFLSITRDAYGSDSIEVGVQFANKSILLAKKDGKSGDSISERDIIITVDDLSEKVQDQKRESDSISEKDILILPDEEDNSNLLETALEHIKKGEKYEARNLLSKLYFKETDSKKRLKIKTTLDTLNKEIVFSKASSKDAIFYIVKSGDTLGRIASRFGVAYKSIMRINNKLRSLIRDGERLKILNGELSLLVDKSDFTLTMLLNGYYIKQYPIGIGMFDKTPEATFVVKEKLENPVWYSPDGIYEYGNPKNLLGTRWIGFVDKKGLYGYGIHGTNKPETIGKAMSNGCIRLRNKDVEELYDYVNVKTKVVIQK